MSQTVTQSMGGSRGGTGGPDPPPLKYHKTIEFSRNIGQDLLQKRSYQASIQCWAIIGTPAKRHLMAFRRRANDGPLIVYLDPLSPRQLKRKCCQSWTHSDEIFWIRACRAKEKSLFEPRCSQPKTSTRHTLMRI